MALGSKVHHKVNVVIGKDALHQVMVVDVTLDKGHIGHFNFLLYGADVAGIGESIKYYNPDVAAMLADDVFQEVGAYEASRTCNKIGCHDCECFLKNSFFQTLTYKGNDYWSKKKRF